MSRKPGAAPARRLWSWADEELLRRNYADSLTSDLAQVLGRTVRQVLAKAKHLGLAKSRALIAEMAREKMADPSHPGRAHQIKPGSVPANKGKKMPPGWAPGRMAETQFKKGRLPSEARNYRPIGSHRICIDGYVERKVSDDPSIYPARRWVAVHRLVWIEAHGEIPDGHLVRFKPGQFTADPEQITVDKLECVSRSEHMQTHTYHRYGPEVASLVQLRGAITRQINKRAKEADPS